MVLVYTLGSVLEEHAFIPEKVNFDPNSKQCDCFWLIQVWHHEGSGIMSYEIHLPHHRAVDCIL